MKYIRPQGIHPVEGEEEIRLRAAGYVATMRRAMSDKKYDFPESSLRLPFDTALFEKTRTLAKSLAGPNLSYVIHIGIGGSSLGTKALYEAVSGTLDGYNTFLPKIIFADTCTPEFVADLTEIVTDEVSSKEEIIVVVASKGGTTTETITNASFLVNALEKKFGTMNDRIVCITDEGSLLWEAGKKEGFHLLPIPKTVGGRFSVFSPVGMFSLLAVGIDVDKILKGAGEEVAECVERGIESDAFRAALDIVYQENEGRKIFDTLLFHPELESFGAWYRQLFAESLGKDKKNDGTLATHHIVPSVSVATVDFHSTEQLYLSAPALFARTIVRVNASHWGHDLFPDEHVFAPLVPGVSGHAPCQIMEAMYLGVKGTYQKRGVSFAELELSDLSPESLGALFQFEMCVVMYVAYLLDINAFDQPHVEGYKEEVRGILINS